MKEINLDPEAFAAEAVPTCDICGQPDAEGGLDWNGEDGTHWSCEADIGLSIPGVDLLATPS